MKSLFWRYLTMTLLLLLICFSLFGVCYIVQSYTYTLGQLQDMLDRDSEDVATLAGLFVESRDSTPLRSMFAAGISAIVYENNEQVIVCDADGLLLYYANREGYVESFSAKLSKEIMDRVMQNDVYTEIGTLGGVYKSVNYTSGRRVVGIDGTVLGAVFVSASPGSARDMFEYYQQIFFIIGMVVLAVGMFVSYIMARNMAKPLRAMSKATRAYALGDF